MHCEILAVADGIVSKVLSVLGTQVVAETALIEIALSEEMA